ncbi:MAG: ACP S-malonyltransferase [Deltaproteobacteria bacterium]|jgi:[acyl-carrier-protein] S-malonyltransferase|nr:ACP S-malonyltransferase [Deltaproteobacteria bacterium]
MTSTAFIFPGQGGQFIGQGKAWAEAREDIRYLFKMADEITERPISRLCFEGPLDELTLTINLQPAVLTVGLAAARLHLDLERIPYYAAGHSLGEFGALCLAGVLTEEEVLNLVAKRAVLMQKSSLNNPGAMAAILNLSTEDVIGLVELAQSEGTVVAANFNTPFQTVISGVARAVAAAARFAQAKGGRVVPLAVSGAFHSPLMAECSSAFASLLTDLEFKTPRFPVVPNALGTPVSDPDELKFQLSQQMTSPVLWVKTIQSLSALPVDTFAECWPRPFLGNIVKKCLPDPTKYRIVNASS